MEKKVYESYLEILREELVPALGCTELLQLHMQLQQQLLCWKK